jgi:hypothetical protein
MQVVEAHGKNFPSFNKNNLSHINQIDYWWVSSE